MFKDEFSHTSHGESVANSDNYSEWPDDVLYRGKCNSYSKRRQLMAMEYGGNHAGNHSNYIGQLYS